MIPIKCLIRLFKRLIVLSLALSVAMFIATSFTVDKIEQETRNSDIRNFKHDVKLNEVRNGLTSVNLRDNKYVTFIAQLQDNEKEHLGDNKGKTNNDGLVDNVENNNIEENKKNPKILNKTTNKNDEHLNTESNKADEEIQVKEHRKDDDNNNQGIAQLGPPQINMANKRGPGEMGHPVNLDRSKLTKEQQEDYDKGWKDNAFNRYVSDMISLHRTLPDVRLPECQSITYRDNLPGACVIIIFHNEAWSVLLRTVHSVINRSPRKNLKQVILVDDFSDFEHLQQPLQDYVDKLQKVTLIRAPKRSGLIRARLMGFDKCTADVAIFLDSHCETTEGWLPPLLQRIQENHTNVLVPIIDVIDDATFKYSTTVDGIKSVYVGGFNWGLIFDWHPITEREMKRISYKTYLPIRSPTMAGGLFAISRKFFKKLGTYDSGFDIWGGENLELSFKTWMCGGTLETIPCSHVGHVYRKRFPYKWGTKVNALKRNLVRLAEVWLDDFKEYYYMRINHNLGDFGDVSERKALRQNLHCKSFKWYLDNIYPEVFVPGNAIGSGEIRNKDRPVCIDSKTQIGNETVSVYPCHDLGGNQFWLLSEQDEIRRDEWCWDTADGVNIKIYGCHSGRGHQEFKYRKDDSLYNPTSGKCVEMKYDATGIQLTQCSDNTRQKWIMSRTPHKGPK